ncbi:MAG: hypothetical protein Q8R21_06315, partial [Burkholderiales bacterium]|nr:hypothetical protein [Burkholderiales bacterium]
LQGRSLQFLLSMTLPGTGYTGMSFSGEVRGDVIEGTIQVRTPVREDEELEGLPTIRLPWRAKRTLEIGYFAPTGTDIS